MGRTLQRLVTCTLILLALLASSGASSLVISVRDSKTHGPVDAQVIVHGPVTVSDVADVDGKVTFDSLYPGSYTVIVRRRGYRGVTRTITLDSDQTLNVDVFLAEASDPKQIASVVVRASNPTGAFTIESSSPVARLSPSLDATLNNIAGVSVIQGTEPGATQAISINGHDPGATQVSLDGIPLSLPGTAFDFASIDKDVLDRITVGYSPSGVAEGGHVALQTLQPTSIWQAGLQGDLASFDRSFWSISAQGTVGQLGVAFKDAFRSNASPLDGSTYKDSSGFDYAHAGDELLRGDALALTFDTSSANSLTFTSIASTSYQDALCTLYTNVLPCGYGPGNYSLGNFHLTALSDSFLIGSTNWRTSAYRFTSNSSVNMWNQTMDLLRVPYGSSSSQTTGGLAVSADIPIGNRDLLSAHVDFNAFSLDATSVVPNVIESVSQGQHYDDFSLGDRHQLSNNAQVTLELHATPMSGVKTALGMQATGIVHATSTQTLALEGSLGQGLNASGSATLLSPPPFLEYDCSSQTVTGQAAGDAASTNAFKALGLTWNNQLPRGDLLLQVYDQYEQHGSMDVLLNSSALNPSLFYPGYFAMAKELYNLSTNCGTRAHITPEAFYFSSIVSDIDFRFQGFRLQGSMPLTRTIALVGSLAYNRAAAWSSDKRLQNPLTIFQPGQQIQGVPFASGYISLSYKPTVPLSPQLFLGARYTGYDNPFFLPPHVVADAAVVQPLERGELSLLVNNIFNTYAGNFQTPQYAVPLVTRSGRLIRGTATPVQPRTLTASYTIGIGHNADIASLVGREFGQPSANDETLVPGYLLVKWPLTAPSDPFRRNVGTACKAQYATIADEVIAPLNQIVSQLNADQRAKELPSVLPAGLPKLPQITVSYQRVGDQYALSLRTTKLSTLQALLGCQEIHVGAQENARGEGLPFPAAQSLTSVTFYYAPSTGLYLIQIPPAKGLAQKFRTYELPRSSPVAPFKLIDGNACQPELKPIARTLLLELSEYFAKPQPTSGRTADWTIVRHESQKGYWYELQSDEIGTVTSLINCGHVSSAGASLIQSMGFGGAASPAFNFTSAFGLYVISGT